MSYAVEFRVTLGTDDEDEARERETLLGEIMNMGTAALNEALSLAPGAELVEQTLYTY